MPRSTVSLISFLILFFVLWKFALPADHEMLDKRADTIRESLEKAEQTRVEAERLLEEYKQQMAEARKEAGEDHRAGPKVAEAMKDDIVAKANEEAAGVIAKAKETIEGEKRAAIAELQASVADLSVAVAGKLIGAEADREDQRS